MALWAPWKHGTCSQGVSTASGMQVSETWLSKVLLSWGVVFQDYQDHIIQAHILKQISKTVSPIFSHLVIRNRKSRFLFKVIFEHKGQIKVK